MRRAAIILHTHRRTVQRKMRFLAEQARKKHQHFLQSLPKLNEVYFDEMESFEHTKCKPLSIPLAVSPQRKLLAVDVASMPAKGLLAAVSRKKYGRRKDERPRVINQLLKSLKPQLKEKVAIYSDQNPSYPPWIKRQFPHSEHQPTKGHRGCVTGQGELKKTHWDPLFALNHTAAMLRANLNRLFRKTWCTTKKPWGLKNHIDIYIDFHNEVLTA